MIIWLLRDGDDYYSATKGRVASRLVGSYQDVCDHHVSDFIDESSARAEADAVAGGGGPAWAPTPIDFDDAQPEDFAEHFDG